MKHKKFEHAINDLIRITFWQRVHVKDEDSCWNWLRSPLGQYGVFNIKGAGNIRTHRVAWAIINGPIPEGMEILHSCHNPSCVNPKHLRPGTQQENMQDRKESNRGYKPKGTLNGRAILTSEQVQEIQRATSDTTNETLAYKYGIGTSQISRIRNKKEWVTN